jgi:sugar transferase (PEP-CTERM/EpsH1 system associated)
VSDHDPPLVLHVLHHLVIGGMENGLVNLVNHMPASQYRHAIACVDDFSDFRDRIVRADVEVFAMRRPQVGVWELRRRLYRLCRQLRPTIVHTRGQSGLDALLPAKLAGVPNCIHGEHGWDVDDLTGAQWKPTLLRRLHSPLVSRYVTVSKDIERFLVDRVGISARRITQIYNGVDTNRFEPAAEKPTDWLPPPLRGDGIVILGTVGRLQPVKDHATLLRAFAALITDQPALRKRLRLAIIGDGPLMGDLRALSSSLGIDPLTWFSGALQNVPDALRALDVFVLPSLNEGISNTILEAMASALPVIATGVGGNPELVEDGVCGRLFAPGDANTLASLLGQYVVDSTLRERHGQAARRIALKRFSLNAMTANYQAVYDRVRTRGTSEAQLA